MLPMQTPVRSGETIGEERVTGEIEFIDSCFTFGRITTTTKLKFFDDAPLTLDVSFSQSKSESIRVVGSARIEKTQRFPVSSLWATFILNRLEASLTYEKGKWSASGKASGAIEFVPPTGKSAAEIGPAAELFAGLQVGFEELDPFKLESKGLSLKPVNPLQFAFAEVFLARINEIKIHKNRPKNRYEVNLTGGLQISNLGEFSGGASFDELTIKGGKEGNSPHGHHRRNRGRTRDER